MPTPNRKVGPSGGSFGDNLGIKFPLHKGNRPMHNVFDWRRASLNTAIVMLILRLRLLSQMGMFRHEYSPIKLLGCMRFK
jgi:hypothetical protein